MHRVALAGIMFLCAISVSFGQFVWRDVYSADATSYAIRSDGTLWGCGWNEENQLGYETSSDRSSQWKSMSDAHGWIMMAGARGTGFFLKNDGTLWTVGSSTKGVSGIGDGKTNRVLTRIGEDDDWVYITSSHFWGNNGFAIKKDGTLWGWGDNTYKQLVSPKSVVIVPTQIGTDKDWVKIVSGESNAIALKKDGTLWAWGSNFDKNLGFPKGSPNIISTPTQIGTDKDWKDVVIRSRRTYALKQDGTVWGCGNNIGNFLFGKADCDAPETIYELTPLDYGGQLIAIEGYANGTVIGLGKENIIEEIKIWGINEDGFLGDGKGVLYQGSYETIPWTATPISPLLPTNKKYKKVTAGEAYVIAISTEGEMYAWGRNKGGQLGDGTDVSVLSTSFRKEPTLIPCPQEKIGTYETPSKSFKIQAFSKYINQLPDALENDMQEACIDPIRKEYKVTFYDNTFVLKAHLDKTGLIDQLTLSPSPNDISLEDWIAIVSKSELDTSEWGTFLGTKFQGPNSGIKKTLQETFDFVRSSHLADYRITSVFSPISGVYFIPEIANGTFSFQLIRSYYPFALEELVSLLGYDYQQLYEANYYICYKMKVGDLSYIYLPYARDDENNIFNINAMESEEGGKVAEVDVYLNKDDNKDIEKSTKIWIHHAKMLTQSVNNFSLYATDASGVTTQTFETLNDAISFLTADKRQSAVTLNCVTGVAQISWVINAYHTFATIIYSPANLALTFDLPQGESLSIEAHSNGGLSVDWGNGEKVEVNDGVISGKLQGESIKVYGDITDLDCSSCKVKTLALNAENIKELACSGNLLTKLDLNGMPRLESLDCENNQLTSLQLSNCTSLKKLLCAGNLITKLSLEKLPELQRLSCSNNQLQELNLSHNSKLLYLNCSNNQLQRIVFTDNMPIVQLIANGNLLENIQLEKLLELERLNLSKNKFAKLDLSKAQKLQSINLSYNTLKELEMTKMDRMQEFIVNNNQIKSLDYSLIPNVMRLNLGENKLSQYDMTANLKLRDLSIYDNEMRAEAFNLLSTSLYSRAGEVEGHIYLLSDKQSKKPHLTKEGVRQLHEKNWKLYRIEQDANGNIVDKELTDENIQLLLSISPISSRQKIQVYPNPASGYIYLSSVPQDTKIKIISLDGRTCLTTLPEGNDTVTINIQDLSDGTYLIVIGNTTKVLQVCSTR